MERERERERKEKEKEAKRVDMGVSKRKRGYNLYNSTGREKRSDGDKAEGVRMKGGSDLLGFQKDGEDGWEEEKQRS